MRKVIILPMILLFLFTTADTGAQILDRVKSKARQAAEKVNDDRKNNRTNSESEERADEEEGSSIAQEQSEEAMAQKPATMTSYANYDFVPGDKIIFQYDMVGETDSEIPGRMAINDGNVEVQTYDGEKVLFVPAGASLSMKPLMEHDGYLPAQFTLEFEIMANGNDSDGSTIELYFRDSADGGRYWDGKSQYYISLNSIAGTAANVQFVIVKPDGNTVGGMKRFPASAVNTTQDVWRKVAVYVNKTIGKVYVDESRVAIVNQIASGAGMVTFEFLNDTHPVLLKNLRIAGGGSDTYNKIITDGKFIAYGILFDVNRANLKPSSMGTINEIAKVMKEHQDLNFEIGGHTDSDGTTAINNRLSQERADAVKQQLVSMGIDAGRLITKGYGSTKPVTDNNSPENKARNRRVEFVKIP